MTDSDVVEQVEDRFVAFVIYAGALVACDELWCGYNVAKSLEEQVCALLGGKRHLEVIALARIIQCTAGDKYTSPEAMSTFLTTIADKLVQRTAFLLVIDRRYERGKSL